MSQELQPGDRLWWVPRYHNGHESRWRAVVLVGEGYARLDNGCHVPLTPDAHGAYPAQGGHGTAWASPQQVGGLAAIFRGAEGCSDIDIDIEGDGPTIALNVGDQYACRIVACWNACEGISTEDLERYYNTGSGIDEAIENASLRDQLAIQKQRDQLLAALEKAVAQLDNSNGEIIGDYDGDAELISEMRAAIAAAKAGA
ncbi:hypothetical protein N8I74_10885 [Chitiniphilus purpureus]|uniref:Uncharacterized protein n=1 Tax=Chitiniphilus purpureus TaxID=2981137 RepID=A0ABY6DHM8_9NEIS|nr:hypothetical protein [Chitiniphilus sp. CD1]UXY13827.1 hypothetical protein N8I74_10885 [Chitiniphilus sp. CD1]